KREVGETVVPSKRLPCETQRTHIEIFRQSSVRSRYNGLQPARLAKRANQITARSIDVCLVNVRGHFLFRPRRKRRIKASVRVVEKRPYEVVEIRHSSHSSCDRRRRPPWRMACATLDPRNAQP